MVTLTSTHARRAHAAATEALLWLVWLAARWTGVAAFLRATRTVHPKQLRVLGWVRSVAHHIARTAQRLLRSVLDRLVSRPLVRLELEISAAHGRLERRMPILLVACLMLANLTWLALR